MHFTPTSASWLSMVERFFRNLTVNRLRRGVFRDVIELVASINTTSSPSLWASRLFNSAGYPEHHDATASLGQEVDRLRKSGEVRCSDRIGEKLKRISPKTIDRLLTGERQTRRLRKNRNAAVHPLLYQKIPAKAASEWDTRGGTTCTLCAGPLTVEDGKASRFRQEHRRRSSGFGDQSHFRFERFIRTTTGD